MCSVMRVWRRCGSQGHSATHRSPTLTSLCHPRAVAPGGAMEEGGQGAGSSMNGGRIRDKRRR